MHNNVFNFRFWHIRRFSTYKIVFIPIFGHQHCDSEWRNQRSFLLHDMGKMGKTCESAPYRSSVFVWCLSWILSPRRNSKNNEENNIHSTTRFSWLRNLFSPISEQGNMAELQLRCLSRSRSGIMGEKQWGSITFSFPSPFLEPMFSAVCKRASSSFLIASKMWRLAGFLRAKSPKSTSIQFCRLQE